MRELLGFRPRKSKKIEKHSKLRSSLRRTPRAELLEDRRMLATITWDGLSDGDGDDINWFDSANWDLDRLPAPADEVVIPSDVALVDFVGGTNNNPLQSHAISSLTVGQNSTLRVRRGSLDLATASTISGTLLVAAEPINSNPSQISGAGSLQINDRFELHKDGRLLNIDVTIAEDATFQVHVDENTRLPQENAPITNHGTMELIGTGFLEQRGSATEAVIDNFGTFIINGGTGILVRFQGGSGTINNHFGGSLIKRGEGNAILGNNQGHGELNNNGLLRVEEGQLSIYRHQTSDGAFEIEAGATLLFAHGIHDLGPGSTITGLVNGNDQASVIVDGNYTGNASPGPTTRLDFAGTYNVPHTSITRRGILRAEPGSQVMLQDAEMRAEIGGRNSTLQSGVLEIQENVLVTGDFQWSAGEIEGSGDAVLTMAGTTSIMGDEDKRFSANLRNAGQLSWTTTGNVINSGTVTIENSAGASWDFQSGGFIGNENFRTIGFVNEGTLQKSAGPTSDIHVGTANTGRFGSFVNRGTISVEPNTQLRIGAATSFVQESSGVLRVNGTFATLNSAPIDVQGGVISGTGRVIAAAGFEHHAGVIRPGDTAAAGKIRIEGDYTQQAAASVEIEIGGINAETNFDVLEVVGNASLAGDLKLAYINGFTADEGQRFPVFSADAVNGAFASENSSSLGLAFQQNAQDITLVGQEIISEIEFDLSPAAIVRVGEVNLLPGGIAGGQVAELRNIRVDLLPDESGGALATLFVESAQGLDEDNNVGTVEGFRIEDNLIEVGHLLYQTEGAALFNLDGVSVLFQDFVGSSDGTSLGTVNLSSLLPEIDLPDVAGAGKAVVKIVDDNTSVDVPLSGDLNLASGLFRLTADQFTVDIADAIELTGKQAAVVLGLPDNINEPILSADTLSMGVNLPFRESVQLTTNDFQVDKSGSVSVAGASATFGGGELTQTLAGILPYHVTGVEITPEAGGRISLRDFNANVIVNGYFDDSLLSSIPGLPTPSILIDGSTDSRPINFRMLDDVLVPWDLGPVSLGVQGAQAEGLTLGGEIKLGGYRRGVWDSRLEGFFSITATDGEPSSEPLLDLRFDILPGGSSLSPGNDLFNEPSSLSVMGQAKLAANFTGKLGGVSVNGATLGVQFNLDAGPSTEAPFVNYTSTTTLGKLSFEEVDIDIANLGRLTTSVILFDLTPPGDNDEPIGHIGKIEVQPHDNPLLSGLDQGTVEVFDANLYRNRLELGRVHAGLDGIISWRGENAQEVDLLLVDDLRLDFENVTILSPKFQDLLDSSSPIDVPFLPTPVNIGSVGMRLDAAVLLPETANANDVPDVECNANGQVVGGLTSVVPGLASIACIGGSFDGNTGGFTLTAGALTAKMFDVIDLSAEGAAITLAPNQPLASDFLRIATSTLTMPLLDGPGAELDVDDLLITQGGEVSIASATASGGTNTLSTFALEDFLPVAVDTISIHPIATASRVFLNRDHDGDSIPDPEFDIRVQGDFNLTAFADLGLVGTARIGEGPVDTFDVTFRIINDESGNTIVAPWNTGSISLGLTVDVGDTELGLAFSGDIELGDYTQGVWNSELTGIIDASAQLRDNDNSLHTDLTMELVDGHLKSGELHLSTQIQFDAGASGRYGSFDLDGLLLGFDMTLGWGLTNQFPHLYFNEFTIVPGEVSLANLVIDVANVVTLTVTDVLHDPDSEAFATIRTIEADFSNNSLLNDLGFDTAKIEVSNSSISAGGINIGSIAIDLDGMLTVGSVDLLALQAFEFSITGIEIAGNFSFTSIQNQTVSVDHNTALVDGSFENIAFGSVSATLLPGSDVTGSVSGLNGSISLETGTVVLDANHIQGKIFKVFEFESDPVTLTAGTSVLSVPFLEVNGETSLTVTLLDEKPITLFTNDFEISQTGDVSITRAGFTAEEGLAHSFGLAEGLLPFDLTKVEIAGAGSPRSRLSLSDRGIDADIKVEGFFDLDTFDDAPFRPVLSMGDGTADQTDPTNTFAIDFNVKADGTDPIPQLTIKDTGDLTFGIQDFQVGPFQLHGREVNGANFASEPATITLGGYENGKWNGTIGLDVGIGWNGIAGDGSQNSSLAIDAVAGIFVDSAVSKVERISDTRTRLFLDAGIFGSLGLGNLPLEADDPVELGWGFQFKNLEFDWDVEFDVVRDGNGFRLEPVERRPMVKLDGIKVDEVQLDFGLFNMKAEHAQLDFDVFTQDSQGNILTSGPFLVFGERDGVADERPYEATDEDPYKIVTPEDLEDRVDGSIQVTVGGTTLPSGITLPGIGGKAGNFGIGWNQANIQLDPRAPGFSLGVEFYQLPGFFVSLVQPQAEDTDNNFNFGLDWFPIVVDEIGLRFKEIIDLEAAGELFDFDMVPTGGGSSQQNEGPGFFERAGSFAMDLLKKSDIIFSGGFDSGRLPFVGNLIDIEGFVEDAQIDIDKFRTCTAHVWNNREIYLSRFGEQIGDLLEDPKNTILAMGAIGYELFSDPACEFPLKGFDAIDGGAGFDFGAVKFAAGLGFGELDFDRNGNPEDGEEGKLLFIRAQGDIQMMKMGIGGEIIITEFGPIMGRLTAPPIPLPAGFLLSSLQGGIVFDGEPLPIIEDPIEVVTNVQIQAPLKMELPQIKSAVEQLFRNGDGTVRDTARHVWDKGFTLAMSGYLSHAVVANSVGAELTLGLNVGYELPEYTLGVGGSVIDALRSGELDIEKLPGSLSALAGVDQATIDAALNAFDNPNGQDPWQAFSNVLKEAVENNLEVDINFKDFLRGFPFGIQLYGLADLQVFGFDVAGMGLMFDHSDPLNPIYNFGAQLPKSGTLLGTLLPGQGEFGLRLDTQGLVQGTVIAVQTFLQKVFESEQVGAVLDLGSEYFATLFDELAKELDANRDSSLAKLILDDVTVPAEGVTVAFLEDRLLGRNGVPGIFGFDLDPSNDDDTNARFPNEHNIDFQKAVEVAVALLGKLMTPPDLALAQLPDSEVQGDDLYESLVERAKAAILDGEFGLQSLTDTANDVFNRVAQFINGEATPGNDEDPLATELFESYLDARDSAKAQTAFLNGFDQVIQQAGSEASNIFFETIDPSLLMRGSIHPTLFGIPLSDTGLEEPEAVQRITENFRIEIDKRGVSLDAEDITIMEKLLRLFSVPLPLYDNLNIGVRIPTENLFRDLATFQPIAIDPNRDWRGTFQGTVGFGSEFMGFDLGDVTGLFFPSVPGEFEDDKPRVGIPEGHPLLTHVHIIGTSMTASDGRVVYGPKGHVNHRVLVTNEDFGKMRRLGGILLDGRLTLPQFITDPIAWYRDLSQRTAEDMAGVCPDGQNLLECFQSKQTTEEYYQFYLALRDADSTVTAALSAEHQIAQVQMFIPNVSEELGDSIGASGTATQTEMYHLFNELTDGEGSFADDLHELLNDPARQFSLQDSVEEVSARLEALKERLTNTRPKPNEPPPPPSDLFIRGVIGTYRAPNQTPIAGQEDVLPEDRVLNPQQSPFPTTGKILGIDLGGALINVEGGLVAAAGFFPPLEGQTPEQHRAQGGLQFEAVFDQTREVGDYPRSGVSIEFTSVPDDEMPQPSLLQDFLESSGIANLEGIGDAARTFARTGDWLLSSAPSDDEYQFSFHSYSPGYDPADLDADNILRTIKRRGGLAISGDVGLNSSFGSLEGDASFVLLSDPNTAGGVRFAGEFNGSGSFSLPNPFDSSAEIFSFYLPTVHGEISSSGCVELVLQPNVTGFSDPLRVHFSLAEGACDAQVVVTDVQIPEPPGANSESFVEIPLRLDQIPPWSEGVVNVFYQILDDADFARGAEYGEGGDWVIRSGGQALSEVDAKKGVITFLPSDVQFALDGSRFAEKSVELIVLGDENLQPGTGATEGNKRLRVEFWTPVTNTGLNFNFVGSDTAELSIVDTDFIVPAKPTDAAIFYDFEVPSGVIPDFGLPHTSSTLDWQTFSVNPRFYATYQDGNFPIGMGMPDSSDATGPGLGYLEPLLGETPPDSSGLAHGFEFNVEVSSSFAPSYIEFWDQPAQALSASQSSNSAITTTALREEWEVFAIVNGNAPVSLGQAREIITVNSTTVPNAHQDLLGWRKLRVDIGNQLREPVPALDAFVTGPLPYFTGDTNITFRLVPTSVGGTVLSQLAAPQRRLDNLALFGGSQQQGGSFAGRQLDFDEFANGRMQFEILEGPGVIHISFDPAAAGIANPVPFDDMPARIQVLGGDATTVVALVVTDRNATWGPLDLQNLHIDSDMKMLDLTRAGEVRGNFATSGHVQEVGVDRIADGSHFSFGGLAGDVTQFVADGPLGTVLGQGVEISVPGTLAATYNGGFQSGRVSAGAFGKTDSIGSFAPDVRLQLGIESLDIRGDFTSRRFETGLASGDNNGSSGPITVVGGSINVNLANFDGDVADIAASEGSIHFGDFVARDVTLISTASGDSNTPQADVSGNYLVRGLAAVETLGGDIRATIETTDATRSDLRLFARPDANGRGGGIYSQNSLHIAGSVASVEAHDIDVNLVAQGSIGSVTLPEDSSGALLGQLTAASIGVIVVHGDAGLRLNTTATHETLGANPAIGSFQVVGGDFYGGSITAQPGTQIDVLELIETGEGGGNIDGHLRIQGDVGNLIAKRVNRRVEVLGSLANYEFDELNQVLLVSNQASSGSIGSYGPAGQVFVEGIPGGVVPGGLIEGRVFVDENGNGFLDDGEIVPNLHDVQLLDGDGNVVANSRTHWRDLNRNGLVDEATETGLYAFNNLPNGEYRIEPMLPDGWIVSSDPETMSVTSPMTFTLDLGIRLHTPWHNQRDPLDVNDDDLISPIDVLLVINFLNSSQSKVVPLTDPIHGFLDTSPDNFISPLDVLIVINFLNRQGQAEGESSAKYLWEAEETILAWPYNPRRTDQATLPQRTSESANTREKEPPSLVDTHPLRQSNQGVLANSQFSESFNSQTQWSRQVERNQQQSPFVDDLVELLAQNLLSCQSPTTAP